MGIQWIGLTAAASVFIGIWIGHVSVRKIEHSVERLWIPIVAALALGILCVFLSLSAGSIHVSTAAGILAVTLFWDSFEFWRQQKRVIVGHAPANPVNPRHARILQNNPAATTLDLLNRDPVSRPVEPEEAVLLVKGKF